MATSLLTKLTGVERIELMAAWPHIWGAGHTAGLAGSIESE